MTALLTVALLGSCAATEPGPVSDSATSDRLPSPRGEQTASPGEPVDDGFPDGWRPAELSWEDCDLPRDGRCSVLAVPLDWDVPDGPTIDLVLGRIPATGERVGSLLVNPGGPGGSGLEFLSFDPLGDTLADRFDLVSWDPRGVGASNGIGCDDGVDDLRAADPDPDTPAEAAALDSAAAAVSQGCAAEDGELLPHVGTADVARDLEAIRRALDDGPLNYLGFSYGTQIGQTYATFFPDRVRAMVLDGVVDPSLGFQEFLLGQTAGFDDTFERNAAACAQAGRAACGVEDLAEAYDRVRTIVEAAPLPGGLRPVGPSALATAAIQTGYVPSGWRDLGPALAAALEGDGAPLWELAAAYYTLGGYTSYAAVVCIDSPPPSGVEAYRDFVERAEQLSSRFGAAAANELAPCASWPAAPVGEPAPLRALGAPPILVVGNTGDPATPYANAVAVADMLDSGVLITSRLDGHTAYGADPCVTELVDRYLVDLEVPDEDSVCPRPPDS